MSSSSDAGSSEETLEIKIRALDSSSYSVRVNKHIPVPALKEQLQPLVGVPAPEQRLIYRGKVLKDDQLLSAYNVEDGHTLHLVPRPQQAPQAQQAQQAPQADPNASLPGEGRVTTSLLVGTINVPSVGDGTLPDFNRIVSAVLGNIPGANIQGGNAQGGSIPVNGGQPRAGAQTAGVYQPMPRPIEVSTDALTTLSLYINRMEQMFLSTGLVAPLQPPPPPPSDAPPAPAAPRANRPMSPALLGSIILRVLSLLNGQAAPILSGLAGQFETEASITDPVMRSEVQAAAVWNGTVLQQLGALLLELGRATLTLSMGSTSDEAFVNAGPAVFISPSGPNPIMVQPMPFQPLGTLSPRPSGWPGVGLGNPSRSLNIHIHTSDVGISPGPEQAPGVPAAAQAQGGLNNFQDGTTQAILQETIMVIEDNGDARLLSSSSRRLSPEGDLPQQQQQQQAQPGLNPGETPGAADGTTGAQQTGASTQQMAQMLNQLWPGLGSLRATQQQQPQQQQAGGNQQAGGALQQQPVVTMSLGPGTLASLLGQLAPGLQAVAAMPNQTEAQPASVVPPQQQQQQQQAPPAQQASVPSVPSVPAPHQAPTPTPAQPRETPAAQTQASSSSETKPKEEPKEKCVASSPQTSAPAGLGALRPLVPRRRHPEGTSNSTPQRPQGETSSGENILANVMGLLGNNPAPGGSGGGGGDLRRVLQQALPVVSQLLAGGLAQQTSSGERNNSPEVNGTTNNATTAQTQNTGDALQKLEGDGSPQDVLRSVAEAAMENSEVSLSDSDVNEVLELSTDYMELLLRDLNSRQRG